MKALIAAATLAIGMMAVTTGTAEARWHHWHGGGWGWHHHHGCMGWGWHHHRRWCRGWN